MQRKEETTPKEVKPFSVPTSPVDSLASPVTTRSAPVLTAENAPDSYDKQILQAPKLTGLDHTAHSPQLILAQLRLDGNFASDSPKPQNRTTPTIFTPKSASPASSSPASRQLPTSASGYAFYLLANSSSSATTEKTAEQPKQSEQPEQSKIGKYR